MNGPITNLAFPKINLTLRVVGKRPDGFHEIESWVMPVGGMHDRVSVQEAESFSLHVSGLAKGVPADQSNLVSRAAKALAEAFGKRCSIRVELTKHIPAGAGLGGGSSDAAATLIGLCKLWSINLSDPKLAEIAATLGSDVPYFLHDGAALLRGRGEIVTPLDRCWHGWIGLVVPPLTIPTAEVYKRWSPARQPISHAPVWEVPDIDAVSLGQSLYNDLEPAAFSYEPKLAKWATRISRLGRPAHMTGSGSGLFTVFEHPNEAEAWWNRARDEFPEASVNICRAPSARSMNKKSLENLPPSG